MSDAQQNAFNVVQYLNTKTGKRAVVVSAALELIAARVSSQVPVSLETEFNNLSKYADLIEAALKES